MKMKKSAHILLLLVFLLLWAPARAQMSPARVLPPFATAKNGIKSGTWVKYSMLVRRTGQFVQVYLAVLEREGKGQWMEVILTDQKRRSIIFKTLIQGRLSAPKKVLKAIVQVQGQLPLLLPESIAVQQLPKFQPGPGSGAKLIKREKVKVAAGTFSARKYRKIHQGKQTEMWNSSQVPGWPMVKLSNSEMVLELAAYGQGARSKVRGKPGKLDKKLLEKIGLQPR